MFCHLPSRLPLHLDTFANTHKKRQKTPNKHTSQLNREIAGYFLTWYP